MFCGASLPSPILSRRNSIHALEEPVKKTGVFVAGLYGYLLKRELRGKQQGPGLFHADLLNVFPEAFSLILFEKEIIVIPMVMKNLLEAGGGHVRSVQTDIPLQLVEEHTLFALLIRAVQLQAKGGAQEMKEADQIPTDDFLCPRLALVILLRQTFQNLDRKSVV